MLAADRCPVDALLILVMASLCRRSASGAVCPLTTSVGVLCLADRRTSAADLSIPVAQLIPATAFLRRRSDSGAGHRRITFRVAHIRDGLRVTCQGSRCLRVGSVGLRVGEFPVRPTRRTSVVGRCQGIRRMSVAVQSIRSRQRQSLLAT